MTPLIGLRTLRLLEMKIRPLWMIASCTMLGALMVGPMLVKV